MKRKTFFVTAIGTDSGKTVVSAVVSKALSADYWKPIQSGSPRDSETIRNLVPEVLIHSETYLLSQPLSPHASAKLDGVAIELDEFNSPVTNNSLVVEGAGGVLVPLNDSYNVVDIVRKFGWEIILVSNHYLGSINHTLLTIDYLKREGFKVRGLVFNGDPNPETERIILERSGLPMIFRLHRESEITPQVIDRYAELIKDIL